MCFWLYTVLYPEFLFSCRFSFFCTLFFPMVSRTSGSSCLCAAQKWIRCVLCVVCNDCVALVVAKHKSRCSFLYTFFVVVNTTLRLLCPLLLLWQTLKKNFAEKNLVEDFLCNENELCGSQTKRLPRLCGEPVGAEFSLSGGRSPLRCPHHPPSISPDHFSDQTLQIGLFEGPSRASERGRRVAWCYQWYS